MHLEKIDTNDSGPVREFLFLAAFIALTFVAALPAGLVDSPGYYAKLSKPEWAPPAWIFGPVWTTLYVLIGVSMWLVWRRRGFTEAFFVWLAQLTLNAAWTPIFFGLHRPDLAFVTIVLLWLAIVVTLNSFRRQSTAAMWLLVPYWLWVTFAAVLNWAIWRMNP